MTQTLYVRFEGVDVAVSCDASEVMAPLASIFAAMLVPASGDAVGRIQVSRDGDSYSVSGDGEGELEEASLLGVLRRVRFSVIQALIEARSDLLWFHAGAVTLGGRAVVFPGARGRGKSTLVTGLCSRGWAYLSDDVVPLSPGPAHVLSFPVTPTRREFPGEERSPDWLQEPTKVDVSIAPESICRHPVPLGAVVFPIYRTGAPLELTRCSSAQAVVELLEQCRNFRSHRGDAVRHLCGLVERVPVLRLSFSDGDRAAELLAHSSPILGPPC